MRRLMLFVLVAVGAGLIVAPLSMSMFSRANDGQQMVDQFRPTMQPASVQATADYYNNVFTKLRPIALAMTPQTVAKFNAHLTGLKGMQQDLAKMPPAQVRQLATQYPAMAAMLQGLPQMQKDFGGLLGLMAANVTTFKQVPAGLDHYKPLVNTMQNNVGTYASVDALPRMGLFPWFFIVPGILIVLSSGYLLLADWQPLHIPSLRHPLPH
jgi:hypothetical protein